MDTTTNSEKPKASIKAGVKTVPLRVKRETKRRLLLELVKANKKDFGRRVRADDLVALAVGLVQPEHLRQLQEATLSNADRLEQRYQEHVKKHGSLSKDEFIGLLMLGGTGTQKNPTGTVDLK